MSDCSDSRMERRGYGVMRIRAEFDGPDTDFPWVYPLALNGRRMTALYVDGIEYRPTILGRFKLLRNRLAGASTE